ncbi:hypothetical protein DNTS_035348 [Danionella cerebrum]|uniref:E3 ubiquitin-protein ligase RNF180 n=1 Tax=Danionella cerebrum TaxID=2873325 RepID=A0A553R0U4_9TELE|nr:hypothetical protein DNTS_035348 [Danionella translucida]
MSLCGSEEHRRNTEALCLEIHPWQRATFSARVAHRKSFSLDCTGTLLREAGADSWRGHTHRKNSSVSIAPCLGRNSPVHNSVAMPSQSSPDPQARAGGSEEDLDTRLSFRSRDVFMTPSSSEEDQEPHEAPEELSGALPLLTVSPAGENRPSKRERRRLRSLRRRQRRRERCRQESLQITAGKSSSSSEDEEEEDEREGFICAVCLDVYFSPYMCHPCCHVFCEPCLRTLAKSCPSNTPCPLCRTTITHVFFQKELNHTARTFFPKEYQSRKLNFQKASCAKWPLPSCRKLFRIFGGFQRQGSQGSRRQFPQGSFRLNAFNFEDDSQRWRFDMDMVIIYIYSINWVIGFIIFCVFCYFLLTV